MEIMLKDIYNICGKSGYWHTNTEILRKIMGYSYKDCLVESLNKGSFWERNIGAGCGSPCLNIDELKLCKDCFEETLELVRTFNNFLRNNNIRLSRFPKEQDIEDVKLIKNKWGNKEIIIEMITFYIEYRSFSPLDNNKINELLTTSIERRVEKNLNTMISYIIEQMKDDDVYQKIKDKKENEERLQNEILSVLQSPPTKPHE